MSAPFVPTPPRTPRLTQFQRFAPGPMQDATAYVPPPIQAVQIKAPEQISPMSGNVAAYGNFALKFLEGLQQSRARTFQQDYDRQVNNIRVMQNDLASILNNPDIAPEDKAKAESLFSQNIQSLYQTATKGADKKNPVINFLGSLFGDISGGSAGQKMAPADPNAFHQQLAEMRSKIVPVSEQIQQSRERMLNRVRQLREESPILFLSDAQSDPEWAKEYAFMVSKGFDPVQDPAMEFSKLPADPFAQSQALANQRYLREQAAKRRAQEADRRQQFEGQMSEMQTPQGAFQTGQQFAQQPTPIPESVLGPAEAPAAPSPTIPLLPGQLPPPAAAATAPQGSQPASVASPATAPGVVLGPTRRQADFVYVDGPTIDMSEVSRATRSKRKQFYLPDGQARQVLEVSDTIDPERYPIGFYDVKTGRPVSVEGLSETKPDVKKLLTTEQIASKMQAFSSQATDFVANGFVSRNMAERDYRNIQRAMDAQDYDGAAALEKAALDNYRRAEERALRAKEEASRAARELASRREFSHAQMTANAINSWQNSQTAKAARSALSLMSVVDTLEADIAADPKRLDSGAMDAALITAMAKMTDPTTGVRDAETRRWEESQGNRFTGPINEIRAILSGNPKMLTKEQRARLLGSARSIASGYATGLMEDAMQHTRIWNGTGARLDPMLLPGISAVTRMYPNMQSALQGRNEELNNLENRKQAPAPPAQAAPAPAPPPQAAPPAGAVKPPATGNPFRKGAVKREAPVNF